ncbi:MAG: DNA polymerase III subunit alpha, partial [Firmicutes bacterium]|nr:DNA polymerase III subunit alpha [Bacillota bacterium]
ENESLGAEFALEDFLQRMGDGELNKRAVENFIKCGAMDCFGYHRSELLAVYEGMMDSVSTSRKKNLDGQMGLFSMLDDDKSAEIPIPKLPELKKVDLMAMEKETTGIYLSGHPMDDYRPYLKGTHVIPIGKLMEEDSPYQDDSIVSVAGIVQSVKMKTTRSNSMMSYVTVEDDTASIEMLAFSNVLNQYGGYLRENSPVVITGRLSIRDEKEPQIVINRARPISDYAERPEQPAEGKLVSASEGTLYLQLSGEDDPRYPKVKAIVNMFPGEGIVKVFFADTRKIRGAKAALDDRMISELINLLGESNVVLK